MSLVLGIETSCDETAAAVVENGTLIRSNVVASQIELHRRFGGVYPELASRQHVLDIVPVIEEALRIACVEWAEVHAIAVTNGPGLVGSLLVGLNAAKALAWAKGLPLIGINHLEAHLYANWLVTPSIVGPAQITVPAPEFPLICLIVSGGHSDIVLVHGHGSYCLLGRTIDDAAGEAFDKVARLLGLGYPGGPAIQAAARRGDPCAYALPRAWLEPSYDFSFSGLKTAVLRLVQNQSAHVPATQRDRPDSATLHLSLSDGFIADVAASFQGAVVEVLVEKARRAAEAYNVKELLLAGGVASNSLLRERVCALGIPVRYPPPALCTDNAAMVAAAGHFRLGSALANNWSLDVQPGHSLFHDGSCAQTPIKASHQ